MKRERKRRRKRQRTRKEKKGETITHRRANVIEREKDKAQKRYANT